VAAGCNDVPAPGGGLYPQQGNDHRDYVLGHDANERHKRAIASEVVESVLKLLGRTDDGDLRNKLAAACRETRLLDITEFGRAVHAEMDALLGCARAGTSTRDCTLYSTTFPCHNCAKHIIAAGIRRVVYIEPYEKSQAFDLHSDAIRPADDAYDKGARREVRKVVFMPFVGVGPRRYFDLFSVRLSNGYTLKRKTEGERAPWEKATAVARVPLLPTSYLEREQQLSRLVTELLEGL
jgi:deoxycytidylate deaminase